MRNIKIIIAYDGTNYYGWQKQKDVLTIQAVIEKKLLKIFQEKIKLIGSSRTDAKVHANEQVANFITNSQIPTLSIKNALNSLLSDDILIKKVEEVSLDFHARYKTKTKIYEYKIIKNFSPFYRNYAYFIPYQLNLKKMKKAAKYLIGKHNFQSFTVTSDSAKNKFCEIKKIIFKENKEFIIFQIEATRFLHKMVRLIMGTLIKVGKEKIKPEDVKKILIFSDKKLIGAPAPAYGLYLQKIKY
ncbi:MAG: tRNA pseudouridine(38-40) synthase TruA [bacterium]